MHRFIMSHVVVQCGSQGKLHQHQWKLQSAGDTDPRLLARLLMGHPQGMAQLVHDHARILAISCGLGGAKGGGSLLLRHSVA